MTFGSRKAKKTKSVDAALVDKLQKIEAGYIAQRLETELGMRGAKDITEYYLFEKEWYRLGTRIGECNALLQAAGARKHKPMPKIKPNILAPAMQGIGK